MTEKGNFETYLSISQKRYNIYLVDKYNLKIIYQNDENINDEIINYISLTKFLDNNIFKIEKLTGNFIKNIFIILENDDIFSTNIGIKKKNSEAIINSEYLKNTLSETKDLFKKNNKDQNIMHIIVNNYLVNGKNYNYFESDLNTKDFCIEINFISFSNNLAHRLEKILGKYQIKINQFLHESYIKKFFKGQKIEFPVMISKILNGFNENEVKMVPKIKGNKGFFEKFFQFFS